MIPRTATPCIYVYAKRRRWRTIGYDLPQTEVDAYRRHVDSTGKISSEDLKAASKLEPTPIRRC